MWNKIYFDSKRYSFKDFALREWNNRRLAAAKRALKKEKEKAGLFPELMKFNSVEERVEQMDNMLLQRVKQYRDSAANFFNSEIGATKATSILLSNSYFNFGIEMLLEDKRAFINFDKVLIKNEVPLLLDKSKIVVEILEDVIPDKNFMTKLKELKNSGYILALDDFTIDYPYKEIIEIVDIIKVDFMLSSKEDIKKIIKKYSNGNKKFLAEKIENVDEFNNAVSLLYNEL